MSKLKKQEIKRMKKTLSDQDKRCVPVAEEVLQIIAKHKPSLANQESAEALDKIYAPIYKEIAELFLAKNMKFVDYRHIMKLVLLAFENTNQYINQRMAESFELAEAKAFGVDNVYELTLQKVENMLKSK